MSQPVSPPLLSTSSSGSGSKVGISSLAFNVDGSLLATKDEAAPTAIWIWDITTMRPVTVLLQHSPVKKLSWHPTRPELLLIQSVHDEPVVYLWSATDNFPVVLSAPLERSGGKVEVNWLPTRWERKPGFVVSNTNAFVLLWPDGRDPPLEEDELEDSQGGDQSLDSVVEMLAGRTPLPDHVQANEWANTMEVEDDYTDTAFEDTFRAKRPLGVA